MLLSFLEGVRQILKIKKITWEGGVGFLITGIEIKVQIHCKEERGSRHDQLLRKNFFALLLDCGTVV